MAGFEPKIIAFLCDYCTFAAADLAGVMRIQYPPNIRIIRLPCSGRLDQIFILKAFEEGADGVMVAGCMEGSCHFQKGNIEARKRVEHVKHLLEDAGVEPSRLNMYNLSSSMAVEFAGIVTKFVDNIRCLGPRGSKED